MRVNHKWTSLRLEVVEYISKNKISEKDFRFLGIYEWQNIYHKIVNHFVDEQYARRTGMHWANTMNGFRKDINRIYAFAYRDNNSYKWMEKLPEIVKCEKVYLLLEDDEVPNDKYWIAECNPSIIDLIINDAVSLLEDYYITDKKFNWLITENHHEVVQFIGSGLDLETIKNVCTEYNLITCNLSGSCSI